MMEGEGKVENGGDVWAVLDRGCTHTAFADLAAFDLSSLSTPTIHKGRAGGQRAAAAGTPGHLRRSRSLSDLIFRSQRSVIASDDVHAISRELARSEPHLASSTPLKAPRSVSAGINGSRGAL